MGNSDAKNHSHQHKNKLGYIDPTVSGIDIGDKLIHVAIPDGKGGTQVKEFGTTTPDLHKIVNTLKAAGVSTAVMESTGVYWIPLYEILESSGIKPILVDAKSVKNVPGRKTDVDDCQWIQTLYSNGLLRAAYRPPQDRLKLRAYVRQRLVIIKIKQIALNHIEKALQLMNIKLSTVLSDIGGVSGFDIIRAICVGERDPIVLARMRNKKCRKPEQFFIDALTGNYREEHIFALQMALEQYDFSEEQLSNCDRQIEKELEGYPIVTEDAPPSRDKDKRKNETIHRYANAKKPKKNEVTFDVRRMLWERSGIDLTALPGVGDNTALLIFAELGGTDVSSWKRSKEFASWLKLCPGNNISGGKRRKSRKQPCSNLIAQALRMSALAAKRTDSGLGAHIRRISGRTDKPKGVKAGAHKLAVMVYNMCKNGWKYHEKGADYYEKAQEAKILKHLQKKAKEYGFELTPIAV